MAFRQEWQSWRPEVQLLTLRSSHRSIAEPIVTYLQAVEAEDKYHRLVVLIPEVQPDHWWQALLHNQRGVILDRAIRRGTRRVVLCRLRYRLGTVADDASRRRPSARQSAPRPARAKAEIFPDEPVNPAHAGVASYL